MTLEKDYTWSSEVVYHYKYAFTGGTPTVFFFPIGAEKPGKAVSPARAGVWRGEGRVRYSSGKEEKI